MLLSLLPFRASLLNVSESSGGFPGGLAAKTPRSHCRGAGFNSWSWNSIPRATTKIYKTQPSQLGFPGGSDGKESTWNVDTWVQSLGWKDPLEKGMVTHSSILVWRIPCTEEPGRVIAHRVANSWTHWVTNTFKFQCSQINMIKWNLFFFKKLLCFFFLSQIFIPILLQDFCLRCFLPCLPSQPNFPTASKTWYCYWYFPSDFTCFSNIPLVHPLLSIPLPLLLFSPALLFLKATSGSH